MISNVLWTTFYFYMFCNVQKTESVKLFKNFVSPAGIAWYTKFQASVTSKMCLLKPERGPCRDRIRMYHYEPSTKNCTTFNWGGCQGNGNRFNTHSECMGYCLTTPDTGKIRPRYCQLTFDYGFCFGSSQRWFFDSKWQVCKSTIYSGCGGNKNNFYSKAQCDQICRFGNPPLPPPNSNHSSKKILIINPQRRGVPLRYQTASLSTTAAANGTTLRAT